MSVHAQTTHIPSTFCVYNTWIINGLCSSTGSHLALNIKMIKKTKTKQKFTKTTHTNAIKNKITFLLLLLFSWKSLRKCPAHFINIGRRPPVFNTHWQTSLFGLYCFLFLFILLSVALGYGLILCRKTISSCRCRWRFFYNITYTIVLLCFSRNCCYSCRWHTVLRTKVTQFSHAHAYCFYFLFFLFVHAN